MDILAEPTATSNEQILRIEHLNKWYGRGSSHEIHVLKDISLELSKGEVLVIIGPSGSGKSTLLRCVNFIAPPDSGSIFFMGRQWNVAPKNLFDRMDIERNRTQLRRHIGMVFQHFNLFPHMTVLQNVSLAPMRVLKLSRSEAEQRARGELAKVGLHDKARAYPSQLSGGQKQRVAIARALAMEPAIMLFDEVTSALDPELIQGVLEEIRKLADNGMTMMIVTHEMQFARDVGDRVMFMDAGQVVEVGRASDVIRRPQHPRTRTFLSAILSNV